MNDMRPPPRDRVAQLVVTYAGRQRRGSGYLIGTGTVLTAAHVVEGAESVLARFEPDLPGERTTAATSWRVHPGADFAVVDIEPTGGEVRPTTFGQVSDRVARLQAQAVGFPRWKLRRDDAPYRDAHHAVGEIAVLSNYRSGSLEFLVPAPPAAAADGGSPWEGMSGAAVWVAGRIVGVVSEHHPGDGLRRLTVARLDLATGSGWDLFALPGELPDVAPLSEAEKIIAAYRAAVVDTAPAELVGRSAELEELARFSAGDEPYAWWQAGPWAGKSALLSWFALHPPGDVDVVAFFISGCLVGESDSDAFLRAMIEQLAVLADESPGAALEVHERRGQFLRLLSAAAASCGAADRRLVLVIDGLDEDTSTDRERIVALLPQRLPAQVRVLIASRPDTTLHTLPAGHPLCSLAIRRLSPSSYGEREQTTARNELDQVLRGDPVEREVLGLITASGGGLSRPDLQELTGRPGSEVTSLLADHFGRTIDERGSVVSTGERGYAFTHGTLQEISQQRQRESLQTYRERLRSWAASYRDRGWPAETPSYLLRVYPRLLAASGDLPELIALATDQARHECLLAATGGDFEALTEISSAAGIAMSRPEPDLGALLRLALSRYGLVKRNRDIPAALPAVWAGLGQVERAVALAKSISAAGRRADALCRVARTLTDGGSVAQILATAQEAVNECDATVDHAASSARLAAAYARIGRAERARELIYAAEQKTLELLRGGRLLPQAAMVAALVAVGERGRAADLAVESTRETITTVHTWGGGRRPYHADEILNLRSGALTLSTAGFPDCAARIADLLREEARYFRRFRTDQELAATYKSPAHAGFVRSPSSTVRIPVKFVGGSVFHHVNALDLIADTIDDHVAGLAERARNLQYGRWPSQWFQQSAMVAVVESLVAHCELEQAEQLARWSMTDEHAAEAQAVIAVALMVEQPKKAAQLATSAEATARKAGFSARSEVCAVLAKELAAVGDSPRAERLAPQSSKNDLYRGDVDVADDRPPGQAQKAVRLVATGAYGRAERLVCKRREAFPDAEPIAEVAAALVRAGKLRRAERLFERAYLSVDRGKPMGVYAAALASAGQRREVERLVKDAFFSDARFRVLVAAAEGFAAAGDVPAAAEFAERAGSEIRDHSFAYERETKYLLVAEIWAAIGDRDRADHMIRDIRQPMNRITVLTVFATTAALAGDDARAAAEIVAAKTILDKMESADQRTKGLVKLAATIAECEKTLADQLARAGIPSSRRLVAEVINSPGWLSAIPMACQVELSAVQALADTLIVEADLPGLTSHSSQ
ncbi:MAG: sle [Actinoallomurus sp.]|jgi:hypothetical protein|nr:sle [Actinoallomurus sp.]